MAFESVLDFKLERPTYAKSLDIKHFLHIKAKLFPTLSKVTGTKCLWSAFRYDFTSRSHNIGVVGLAFLLEFLDFFLYHSLKKFFSKLQVSMSLIFL